MIPRDNNPHPGFVGKMPGLYMVMGNTAEVVAKRYRVSRESQDRILAFESAAHRPRAARGFLRRGDRSYAVTRGVLDKRSGELVGKEEATVNRDECTGLIPRCKACLT